MMMHCLNASPCTTTEGEGWLMEFQPAPGSGEPRTVAYANRAKLDPHSAYLLDLDPDRFLHERVIMLIVDDEPVLTAHSYLPAPLDEGLGWRQTPIGRLALTDFPVRIDKCELHARMPFLAEIDTLAMDKRTPLTLVSYRMTIELGFTEPERAGLLIKARGDRVEVLFQAAPSVRMMRFWESSSSETPSETGDGSGGLTGAGSRGVSRRSLCRRLVGAALIERSVATPGTR